MFSLLGAQIEDNQVYHQIWLKIVDLSTIIFLFSNQIEFWFILIQSIWNDNYCTLIKCGLISHDN